MLVSTNCQSSSNRDRDPFSQERFIEWVNTHENVHWVPMIDIANEFRAKNSPAAGAKMPANFQ